MTPTTFIDPSAELGYFVKVWHFAVILARAKVGNGVSIGSHSEIGRESTIGDSTRISAHVFLPSNSRIGRNVFIGPNVTFTDDRHPVAGNRGYTAEPPIVEDDASIGAGSVILPGVTIGAHSTIGAGSVITEDVPPGAKYYGEKARPRPVPSRDHTSLFDPPLMCEQDSLTQPSVEVSS